MFTRFVNRREARCGATRERDARGADPFNRMRVYLTDLILSIFSGYLATEAAIAQPRMGYSGRLSRLVETAFSRSRFPRCKGNDSVRLSGRSFRA